MSSEDYLLSIVVLNYNGMQLLEVCLPAVLKAVAYTGKPHKVILLDNNSTDESIPYVKESFPEVKIIKLNENKYIYALNDVVSNLENKFILFLNNDIILEENILPLLLAPFKGNDVFAVMSKLVFWDKKNINARNRNAEFKKGLFWLSHDIDTPHLSYSLFAPGGASVYDRDKFIQLGGFDDLYRPFYFDDVDLSFRAWKRGWKIYYEPKAVMYHKCFGTIRKMVSNDYMTIINLRNNFLFIWKNITDRKMLFEHFIFLLPCLIHALLRFDKFYVVAFIKAIARAKEALANRKISHKREIFKDRQILQIIRQSQR